MKGKLIRRLLEHWMDLLLVFIPVAIVLHFSHATPVLRFVVSGLAIIPLAGWMGKSTESLASKLGAGMGGLLNATFGNAAEMIIAFQGLRAGLVPVVKASLTGSILGNLLLVLGMGMVVGGMKHRRQKFNRTAVGMSATLMVISAIGLLIPALFHHVVGRKSLDEQDLSLEIAVVLFATYLLSLVFSLHTHKDLYMGEAERITRAVSIKSKWAFLILATATALIAWMSDMLVGSVEAASRMLGLSELFVGIIVIAIIGNAAEHSTAIVAAYKNKADLAFHIALGSSAQMALFVAPLLVFLSYAIGKPMDLLFTTFEVISVGIAVFVVHMISTDGESNWMEGALLLAVYLIIAIAFYFLPMA